MRIEVSFERDVPWGTTNSSGMYHGVQLTWVSVPRGTTSSLECTGDCKLLDQKFAASIQRNTHWACTNRKLFGQATCKPLYHGVQLTRVRALEIHGICIHGGAFEVRCDQGTSTVSYFTC